MTVTADFNIVRPPAVVTTGSEHQVLEHLVQRALSAGVAVHRRDITNLYVALKSKPLLVLYGPPHTGKVDLFQVFGEALTGGDPLCFQSMVGHAWWAARSGDVAMGTMAQTRFNTEKIFALIDEALQLENAGRMFMGRLNRISLAEIAGLFSDLAFQLRHGQVMRLPVAHLMRPVPYPPNLALVATLDHVHNDWSDANLLAQATIVGWSKPAAREPGAAASVRRPATPSETTGAGETLLRSAIRDVRNAVRKLQRIGMWGTQQLSLLSSAEKVLEMHQVSVPQPIFDAVLVYLANAWSEDKQGLFDSCEERNLQIALDFALTQTLLPLVIPAVRQSPGLRKELTGLFDGLLPRAAAHLEGASGLPG